MRAFLLLSKTSKKGGPRIYCFNCGVEKGTGRFCGNCGVSMEEIVELKRYSGNPTTLKLESFKSKLVLYREYFINSLKKPDSVLEQDTTHFGHGLTTLLLFITLLGFANYLMNPVSTKLVPAVGNVFVSVGMGLALSIGALFLLLTFFGNAPEVKSIIGLFGTYLVLVTVPVGLSLLLLLLKASTIAFILLTISILYAIMFLPLYLLTRLLGNKSSTLEPYHSYIAYLVLFYSLYYLYLTIVFDAKVTDIFSWLTQF